MGRRSGRFFASMIIGVSGVGMGLGITMAAANQPIAMGLSLKLAMTAAGTASLATGLLAAGIIIAAVSFSLFVLGLFLAARSTARASRSYLEVNSSYNGGDDVVSSYGDKSHYLYK